MKSKFLCLLYAVSAILFACQTTEKKLTIGFVQITDDPALNSAKDGVFKALADSGFKEGEKIKILDNNAHGDLSMIPTIIQTLLTQNVDMIITNSTPCMASAAQLVKDRPVVFTVAFSPQQVGIKGELKNVFGMYDSIKASEFTDLLFECIPGLKRIGIPFNNAEKNAEYSVKILSEEFTRRGIDIVTAPVNSVNDLMQAAQSLLSKDIDVFVASADNTVYLGLPVLVKLAIENKKPIFVTDPSQIKKGAALGLGVNYESWGYLSGLKAVEILKGRTPAKHIEVIPKYQLAINLQSCAAMGLTIPESVIARSDWTIK
jgi:putative tryptophan/tyrosine transport system substrate-binding protein